MIAIDICKKCGQSYSKFESHQEWKHVKEVKKETRVKLFIADAGEVRRRLGHMREIINSLSPEDLEENSKFKEGLEMFNKLNK